MSVLFLFSVFGFRFSVGAKLTDEGERFDAVTLIPPLNDMYAHKKEAT